MPECRYCGETFADEDAHTDHLEAEHADELGRIDRRRVGGGEDDGPGVGTLALGVVALAVVAVPVAYFGFFADGGTNGGGGGGDGSGTAGTATRPVDVGSVHYHGTIEVVIEGRQIDFSRSAYQYRTTGVDAFHFEGGDGSRWHVHARRVTLGWAMASLGIEVTENSVTVDGETYRDGGGTTVIVEVNGESVTPSTYVLQEGDHVRIVVR